jgi:hypothetical protein
MSGSRDAKMGGDSGDAKGKELDIIPPAPEEIFTPEQLEYIRKEHQAKLKEAI